MITDPVAECERVRSKYAPMRPLDVALYVGGLIALAIASLFREVAWSLYAGMVSGAVTWEFTKWRLRRNARRFVRAVESAWQ